MLTEFTTQLRKGENKGAWTCVRMDGRVLAGDTVVVRLEERLG